MATLYLGRALEAQSALQHGLRLNSRDPHNFVWFDLLALAYLFAGKKERAVEAATQALKIRPVTHLTLEVMAICHAAIERTNDARQYLAAARKISAQPIPILAPLRARNPQWREVTDRLLKKANDG
jgi:Flp pilus assembly protein TadD